jgi:hypothetical protein
MRRRAISTALVFLFGSISAIAGVSQKARVEGVVDGLDGEAVTLWVRGKLVKVGRDSIPPVYKVAPGQHVEAYVISADFVRTKK